MLPNEHGFFYQNGAKAIKANNPMADMRNIIWGGGGLQKQHTKQTPTLK